ncbi:Protein N-acetyltransferase, RimJ/RimL family [Actinacidiphila yanglinensis]|uniref:Protein N-acetyltransferase, RimJ/RimL family n=1 Tax=Actinacidiphila yanglinensis TaxID=310779 RepID=A0A1H6DPY6_9ACTN|nr:GNAT family protein [Actinacidiphila yanglinensis]SEG87392.1 Protein N-acetyltransferase, RimJ/RimL family [Actinacidiphila yanglinensis]
MVELREFEPADGRLLATWVDGPVELWRWSGKNFSWPLDEQQLAAYAAESATPLRRSWMAVDPRDGRAVGHASVRVDAAAAGGRLGRVLVAPEARGKGFGAAMVAGVLTRAFGELGLERVELGVWDDNAAAVRLYEGLGFVCDHVLRDVTQHAGRSWSAMQMSMRRSSWEAGASSGLS